MTGWLIGIAIILVIELYLVWRIARALALGIIRVDPLFWLADTGGFSFSASRATSPIVYWLGVLVTMGVAVAVLAIFAVIVVANSHG